jgi:hypothetical protein
MVAPTSDLPALRCRCCSGPLSCVGPEQVRVVVWKTRNVVAGDEFTGMSDLYAKLWMDGCEAQKTDTHLRLVLNRARVPSSRCVYGPAALHRATSLCLVPDHCLRCSARAHARDGAPPHVHLLLVVVRCKNGAGSFNWRMIFNVKIPSPSQILYLQLW